MSPNFRHKVELTLGAALPAVPICELKAQSYIDDDSFDDLLSAYEQAACEYVETFTRRKITQKQFNIYLGRFPEAGQFYFPFGPIASIESVHQLDDAGTWIEVDSSIYRLGRGDVVNQSIYLNGSNSWPALLSSGGDLVRISFTTSPTAPKAALQAVRLLVAHWWENREASTSLNIKDVPMGVEMLLQSIKTYEAG